MRTTIDGIDGLPAPDAGRGRSWYYLRSLSDPRYLIDGRLGTVYVRDDGEPWERGAYWVRRERDDSITREPGTAYADHQQYPAKAKAA